MEPAAVPPQAVSSGSPAPQSTQVPGSLPVTQWSRVCCVGSRLESVQSEPDGATLWWGRGSGVQIVSFWFIWWICWLPTPVFPCFVSKRSSKLHVVHVHNKVLELPRNTDISDQTTFTRYSQSFLFWPLFLFFYLVLITYWVFKSSFKGTTHVK